MSNFIIDDIKRIAKGDNHISKIILINVVLFILDNLFNSLFKEWLGLPGSFMEFIFKPWTIITYMFMHASFIHILFNMLWFYWLGQLILEYIGKQRLIAIYFVGGIAGGLTYLIVYNLISLGDNPQMGPGLIGASAGVMAVVIAFSTLKPDYEMRLFLLGSIKMKYLGLGILILTSILDFSVNMGGKLAHLGGAAVGFSFIRGLQSGNDWSKPFYGILGVFSGLFSKKKTMKVVKKPNQDKTKTRAKKPPLSSTDQQRIDAILDKISASGYDTLTAEEKEFLFRASNKK